MAPITQKPTPSSRSGGRKKEPSKPAAATKLKTAMKAKKPGRNSAVVNNAHLFPFEAPPSTSKQKSAVSVGEGPDMRRGRTSKTKKKDPDMLDDSALDHSLFGTPVGTTQLQEVNRDPPSSTPIKESHHTEIQSRETTPLPEAADGSDESVSSETARESSPPKSEDPETPIIGLQEEVANVLNALRKLPETHIELPNITDKANSYHETPYSPEFLTELYLLGYKEEQWNVCDLVADTWIRALQSANQDENNNRVIWRENTVLLKKQAAGKKGFDEDAPNYKLDVQDPAIDPDTVRFDETRLNELYEGTTKDCGARLLWADAMAMCGDQLEDMAQKMAKRGRRWHPDLVFDVMCTSLRMVRRKLTLKVEEGTEGAWCKRYHEHTKHDQPCYRWLAWQERKGEGVVDASKSKRKRGRERGADGDENVTKRVRFESKSIEPQGEPSEPQEEYTLSVADFYSSEED